MIAPVSKTLKSPSLMAGILPFGLTSHQSTSPRDFGKKDELDLQEPIFFLGVFHDIDLFHLVLETEFFEGDTGFETIWCTEGVEGDLWLGHD